MLLLTWLPLLSDFNCAYFIFSFSTIASLDYETFSEFFFRIHVRDSGQPSRSADSPAEVLIKVSKSMNQQLLSLIFCFDCDIIFALCLR